MDLVCQQATLSQLVKLSEHHQHGVLIVGNPGSGKTYLASRYAKLLGISDFYKINPVIADLKTTIDLVTSAETPVVLCIENLDDGVSQSSYPLLKFIEDCPKQIYVVVTCSNYYALPDTIPSRCALVQINPPTSADITQYALSKDPTAYAFLKDKHIWKCINGFEDVDVILKFTPEHLKYFDNLDKLNFAKDTVSNLSWRLQHYDDNSETPLAIVMRYLMGELTGHKHTACIDCLNDLADNRLSKNAIVSKLVFEIKYT